MVPNWQTPTKNPTVWLFISQLLLLILTLSIYWPGLKGAFLFDDFSNINALGAYGGVVDWESLKLFVLGNHSGPTGRPVTMLSFLLNDMAWPSDARSFKYTNLMLHLINGVLVFWLTHRLLTLAQYRKPLTIAMLTCLVWLVHPLQVSTVLYVIQRMTELSALFVLVALIAWLYGRDAIAKGDISATWRTSLLVIFFGLLALFSKENGALIPLYILALEVLLNPGSNRTTSLKLWLRYFAVLPTLIIIIFLAYKGLTSGAWEWRPFSLTERLLSEAHALTQYLIHIVIPRINGIGIFHDDFPVSTSLLRPAETLPSVLLMLALLISAWHWRRRLPLYSFAIAWFFAGHAMESTVLPLELYIEHRNYLPMMGILLALVAGVIALASKLQTPALLLLAGYIVACGSMTYLNANLWGKPLVSATVWAKENPESLRAQLSAISIIESYAREDKKERIWRRLRQARKYHPENAGLQIIQLLYLCKDSSIKKSQINEAIRLLESSKLAPVDLNAIHGLAKLVQTNHCNKSLSLSDILDFLAAAKRNPVADSPAFLYYLHYIHGEIYVRQGDLNKVMHHYDLAYQYNPLIDIRLQQIFYLYTAGLYSDATKYLDNLILESSWLQSHLYQEKINALRGQILQAQQHSTKNEN